MAAAHQSNKKVLTYLRSKNADVAFIQETNFTNEDEALKLKCDWVGNVFNNSISSKSCGGFILIDKKTSMLCC